MAVLFSDLDNTLIRSHRHDYYGEIVWVEYLNGHQQSYMTKSTYDYFRRQNWLQVIPVTTRTIAQYNRLSDMSNTFGWNMALVCNGAILLINGKEDRFWTEESLQMSIQDRDSYSETLEKARMLVDSCQIIEIPDLMFYIKTENVDVIYNYLLSEIDRDHVQLHKDVRKIYCFPKSLNKGTAIERLMKRLEQKCYIAAGDSDFDISMLEKTSISLCPEDLSKSISIHGKLVACSEIFSDTICGELEKIRREGNYSD